MWQQKRDCIWISKTSHAFLLGRKVQMLPEEEAVSFQLKSNRDSPSLNWRHTHRREHWLVLRDMRILSKRWQGSRNREDSLFVLDLRVTMEGWNLRKHCLFLVTLGDTCQNTTLVFSGMFWQSLVVFFSLLRFSFRARLLISSDYKFFSKQRIFLTFLYKLTLGICLSALRRNGNYRNLWTMCYNGDFLLL